MPLKMSTASPTHPVTLHIDGEPVRAHVKRFSKDEGLAFTRAYTQHSDRRGTDIATPEEEAAARAFLETTIRDYIAFEPGDVVGDEGPIATGAQIVDAFFHRSDVLAACYFAVHSENCLGVESKKKLRRLGIFSPGSDPSTRTPAGDPRRTTAASADSSSTARAGDVEALPSAVGSGAPRSGVH